ncbi:MAG: hypothetical protein EOO07_30985, partial [Chitinophagaceae bacterium]
DNDPWIEASKAAFLALLWGADFLRLKQLGHINSDSNIGFWGEGITELSGLTDKARQTQKGQGQEALDQQHQGQKKNSKKSIARPQGRAA